MTYPRGASHGYSPRSYHNYPLESYRHSRRSPLYAHDEPIRHDHSRDAYGLVKGHRHRDNQDQRVRHHHDHDHRGHGHHRHDDHDRHYRDDHSNNSHHKEYLAEGAVAAAAAAELVHKYRKKEGEEVSSGWGHFARTAGAGALGALAVNEVSRARRHNK